MHVYVVCYPLAQLRWRRGYSIWFVRPSVRPSSRPSVRHTLGGVVLCALLLQSGKAVDFKTYADLLLTYCSCAPCIQFVRKSIYLVKIEVKT